MTEVAPHPIETDVNPEALEALTLPENVILLATHGTDELPDPDADHGLGGYELTEEFQNEVLQRNFTDVATGDILEQFIPKGALASSNIIKPPRYARLAGDPNRRMALTMTGDEKYGRFDDEPLPKGKETVRKKDFNGIKVFEVEPSAALRALWLDESHRSYYEKAKVQILNKLESTEGPVVVVDIHDTGDFVGNPDGTMSDRQSYQEDFGIEGFFGAVVSDLDHSSASPEVFEKFSHGLQDAYDELGVDMSKGFLENDPYKGGQVTQQLGEQLKQELIDSGQHELAARLNVIQLELNRSRLMNEHTQEVDQEGVRREAEAIQRAAIAAVA